MQQRCVTVLQVGNCVLVQLELLRHCTQVLVPVSQTCSATPPRPETFAQLVLDVH